MKVDNPSEHGPHLFIQPTIYKFEAIQEGREGGRRLERKGNNTPVVRGGVHLTSPAFIPNSILKEMTATEEQFYKASVNFGYLLSAEVEDLDLEVQRVRQFFYKPMFLDKFGNLTLYTHSHSERIFTDDISDVTDVVPQLPWYLDCNRERFPYWFGMVEPRHRIIHQKIRSFSAKHGIKQKKLCPQLFEGAKISCFFNKSQLII